MMGLYKHWFEELSPLVPLTTICRAGTCQMQIVCPENATDHGGHRSPKSFSVLS